MSVAVTLDGTPLQVGGSVTVTNGLEEVPTASVSVPGGSAAIVPAIGGQAVTVALGYGAATPVEVFAGRTRAPERTGGTGLLNPAADALSCEGMLGRAALAGAGRAYSNVGTSLLGLNGWTDTLIAGDLLAAANLTAARLEGEDRTLATQKPLVIPSGAPILAQLRRLDRLCDCVSFEHNGQAYRLRWPATTTDPGAMDWVYTEGGAGLPGVGGYLLAEPKPKRVRSQEVKDRVLVLGYQYPQPHATYFNRPHRCLILGTGPWNTETVEDDLIESQEFAESVAARTFAHRAGLGDDVTFRVMGNPFLRPGQVIGVQSAILGIPALTPYVLAHFQHAHTAETFFSDLRCIRPHGGIGAEVQDVRAIADFSYSGTVAVTCDGANSRDWDGTQGGLGFRWYSDQNPTDLSGPDKTDFAVAFRDAEWAAGPTVFLEIRNKQALGMKLGRRVG